MKESIVRLFLNRECLIRTRNANRPFRAVLIDVADDAVILKHNGTKSALMLSEIVSLQEVHRHESYAEVEE